MTGDPYEPAADPPTTRPRPKHGRQPTDSGSGHSQTIAEPRDQAAVRAGRATDLDPALGVFKDWSNYLLVTTVAAAGWVGSDKVALEPPMLQVAVMWCLGLSAVFGILTLALIPLVAEQKDPNASIYQCEVTFHVVKEWHAYLTMACRPQHILFMIGIVLFCVGSVSQAALRGTLVTGAAVATFASVLGLMSRQDFREWSKSRFPRRAGTERTE